MLVSGACCALFGPKMEYFIPWSSYHCHGSGQCLQDHGMNAHHTLVTKMTTYCGTYGAGDWRIPLPLPLLSGLAHSLIFLFRTSPSMRRSTVNVFCPCHRHLLMVGFGDPNGTYLNSLEDSRAGFGEDVALAVTANTLCIISVDSPKTMRECPIS